VSTPENPARWAPDPLGRHQYRYWDGAQWTDHVADDGRVSADPPVAGPAPTTPTTPTTPAPTTPGTPTTPGNLGAPVPGSGASSYGPTPAPYSSPGPAWSQPATAYDPTKVLGRRYGAFLIDAAICLIAFGIFFFATASTHTKAEMLRMPGCHLSANDSSQVECDNRAVITVDDTVYEAELGVFAALSVVFTFVYFAVVEGLSGGSLGKHLVGLRVVTPRGDRPGIGRSSARWALFAIDGPISIFLCGIITSSASPGHRRLGDMGANTYVIARADAGRPVTLPHR
jgi:uncharacterized RDD family membrane protein YckC